MLVPGHGNQEMLEDWQQTQQDVSLSAVILLSKHFLFHASCATQNVMSHPMGRPTHENKNTNNEPLVGMSSENFACPRDHPTPAINTPDIRAGAAMFRNEQHGGFNSQLIGAAS